MDGGRRIGDFETVEKRAQLLLDLDPLSEDGVRGVMEARAWVGDRSNALKVYGRFETRLAEELGAKPSSDLVRIAGLLREGRRAAPRPTKAGQVSERHERRFEAEPLIGREREFARLYDAWLGVRRREPQDRKSTRLNSSHLVISYAVFCLKKKQNIYRASSSERTICAHT